MLFNPVRNGFEKLLCAVQTAASRRFNNEIRAVYRFNVRNLLYFYCTWPKFLLPATAEGPLQRRGRSKGNTRKLGGPDHVTCR